MQCRRLNETLFPVVNVTSLIPFARRSLTSRHVSQMQRKRGQRKRSGRLQKHFPDNVVALGYLPSFFLSFALFPFHNYYTYFILIIPLCLQRFVPISFSRVSALQPVLILPEKKREEKSATGRRPLRPSLGINADSTFLPFMMFSWRGHSSLPDIFVPRYRISSILTGERHRVLPSLQAIYILRLAKF